MGECRFEGGKCFCPECLPDDEDNRVELFYDEDIEGYYCEDCLEVFYCSELPKQKLELKPKKNEAKAGSSSFKL